VLDQPVLNSLAISLKVSNASAGKNSVACEFGIVLCSARLQAGICLIPKCPPEGGRYINPANGFHTHIL
jgi:hypothetical protein